MKGLAIGIIVGGICFTLGAYAALHLGNSANVNLLYFPALGALCIAGGGYAFTRQPKTQKTASKKAE